MIFPGARTVPTSYLFVDGGNFWELVDEFSKVYHDGSRLGINWGGVRAAHRKVYFYDAVPVQQEAEDDNTYGARIAPKLAQLAEIERSPGFHVRSGDRRYGGKRRGNEQKMVDVQLAVDALQMASRGLFDIATFITGDLDFKPLLDALVDLGVDVNLQYPPGVTNDKLIVSADRADPSGPISIASWIDRSKIELELPEAMHAFRYNLDDQRAGAELEWTDEKYGLCIIRTIQGGKFKLIADRSLHSPQSHNLEIIASRMDTLRAFATSSFGLRVPDTRSS